MYQKSWWYDPQFLKYRVWQTEISNYGSFLPFKPSHLKNPKNWILKKWKKLLEISSFYTNGPKTTITPGMVPEIQSETKIFIILDHFCPFKLPPLTTWKIKILKNWKKHLEMSSFHTRAPKITIISCMLP